MKRAALLVMLCVARIARACPACASGNSGGPRWLHLVMVILPFVVVAGSAWAIRRVLGPMR